MTKAESRLRGVHRSAIREAYPDALIVSQPASETTGPGRTDFYVIVRGLYVGLEIKTSTGRATPIQLERIRRIQRAGGWAGVVRTPDDSLALIRRALKESGMFADLFKDDEDKTPPAPVTEEPEIQAFMPEATEPSIEKKVLENGLAIGGDGAMQEPPGDYPFAVIIQRLNQTQVELARVEWLIRALFGVLELEIPAEAALPAEPAASQPAPRTRRSKSTPKE